MRSFATRSGRATEYRAAGYWSDRRPDHVRIAASDDGDRIAVIGRGSGATTYAQLDRRIDAAAETLRAASVPVGDPVVVVAGNDLDGVISLHAATRVGAVVVAVSRAAGPADRSHAVAATAPGVGIAPPPLVAELARDHPDVAWLDASALGATPSTADAIGAGVAVDPDAPALVLFTSGTTATPKGVVHAANTLEVGAGYYIDAVGLTPDDRLFLVSPLASITGILQALVIAPRLRCAVVLEDAFAPAASLDLLESTGATFYGGPDVVVARLLEAARARGTDAIGLRSVAVGGTMLDATLLAAAEREFGIRVNRAYGSSEAPFSTGTTPADPARVRATSDGQPGPGTELRIGTANDPGELAIRGPHVCLGYLDPADDGAAFDAGWFCTGDVAELDDDGLRIVGRIKDVAVRNGMKVSLAEVERAVAAVAGVEACVAFRMADAATGEHVAVAVRGGPDLRRHHGRPARRGTRDVQTARGTRGVVRTLPRDGHRQGAARRRGGPRAEPAPSDGRAPPRFLTSADVPRVRASVPMSSADRGVSEGRGGGRGRAPRSRCAGSRRCPREVRRGEVVGGSLRGCAP